MKEAKKLAELEELGFEKNSKGVICYKRFNFFYAAPGGWKIKRGETITSRVDKCRGNDCGFGINVGTLSWMRRNAGGFRAGMYAFAGVPVTCCWKCLILYKDLHLLIIPLDSTGKVRCGRLKLLYPVDTRGRRLPVRAPQRKAKGVSKPKRRNQQ